MSYMDINKAVF